MKKSLSAAFAWLLVPLSWAGPAPTAISLEGSSLILPAAGAPGASLAPLPGSILPLGESNFELGAPAQPLPAGVLPAPELPADPANAPDAASSGDGSRTLDWLFEGAGRAQGEIPDHMKVLMGAEQRLLSREVDSVRIHSPKKNLQMARYSPEKAGVFNVKSYWIDAERMHAFQGEGLPAALRDAFIRTEAGQKQVRLLVHPESEKFYSGLIDGAAAGEKLKATPTSSSRSLLLWEKSRGGEAFFGKVSLDAKIGGAVRTIPQGEVARSIGINNLLKADAAFLPQGFKTFSEVLGVMPKGWERGGMILRAVPPELQDGRAQFVPLFALYARPPPGKAPLIADMISRSGLTGEEFIRTRIFRPFIEQWLALAVGRGIVMEAHAQNVLLELGPDGMPTGAFLHRDFGGFNVDWEHRRRLGLPEPSSLPVITTQGRDYHAQAHTAALNESLHSYFLGGFVHNLDQGFRTWVASGWVRSLRPETKFKNVFSEEFEAAYKRLTGMTAGVRSFSSVDEAVRRARRVRP